MTTLLERLSKLSAAEDFLAFFDIDFDERVVHVYRLHILKRFYQYLNREPGLETLDEAPLHERYRSLLQRAHDDFLTSTAAREKVFKVFQDAQGKSVSLDQLSSTLPSRSSSLR
jgi:nitrogenase-stabilizing/protective protein